MSWAISPVNHGQRPAYFDYPAATVEQLGATRSVLRQVITLANNAAMLSDTELRDRLLVEPAPVMLPAAGRSQPDRGPGRIRLSPNLRSAIPRSPTGSTTGKL